MKAKEKKDTSTYLVHKFLSSDNSYQLKINSYDIAILYTIARFLDMPNGQCFGFQSTIAEYCHISEREFRRRTKYLSDNGVILRIYKNKKYAYTLGEKITGIIQELEDFSPAHWAVVAKNLN